MCLHIVAALRPDRRRPHHALRNRVSRSAHHVTFLNTISDTVPTHDTVPAHLMCYVTVDDVNATVEKAVALGGKVIMGPIGMPSVGRFCIIEDPEEVSFGYISPS